MGSGGCTSRVPVTGPTHGMEEGTPKSGTLSSGTGSVQGKGISDVMLR